MCRKREGRDAARAQRLKQRKRKKPLSPAVREFRALAKYAGYENPEVLLREVLQETIRDNVSQHVKDNLLGAGEMLTGMLPKVLSGILLDLESKDWMIRSRAQAAVLKYAFEFKDKDGNKDDLGTIQVVHNVALPNTPLGEAVAGEIIEQEEERAQLSVEAFEQDWPVCTDCGERKHPDTIYDDGHGHRLCSSCNLTKAYRYGKTDPSSIHEDPHGQV